MFSIYLPSNKLVRLAIHNPEQKYSSYHDDILDKILMKQAKIHIYGDDAAQIIDEMRDAVAMAYPNPDCYAVSIFHKYIHNASCQIDDCSDIIKAIEKDNSEILKYNGAFFIFDESIDVDVKTIREEYGVLCQSADDIDMSELRDTETALYSFDVEKTPLNNWSTMLKGFKGIPSNSLCVTDRYLFRGDNYRKDFEDGSYIVRYDGIDTICEVVKCLISGNLKCKYQINILMCFDNLGKDRQNLSDIHQRFKERFGEPLFSRVEINIFAIKSGKEEDPKTHKPKHRDVAYFNRLTHSRRLFTPYFIARADNGICVVRHNSKMKIYDESAYTQHVLLSRLYSTGLFRSDCTSIPSVINDFCKDFKAFIDDYKHHYKDSYYYDFEPDNHDGKIYRGDYQFMSSNGETDLLKYLENNKIWLMEYAKE